MQTQQTRNTYALVEEALDLSNLTHFELLPDGGIKCVPIFSNDAPTYFSREQLGSIHPKLGYALNKMRELGMTQSSSLTCLEATCKLWDLGADYRHYDQDNGLWLTWDSIRDNHNGDASLRRKYLVGGNYDGLPVISEVIPPSRRTQSWSSWEHEYPGLYTHYHVAEGLGLSDEDIARYCFQQVYHPQSRITVNLPDDGLSL